MENFDIYKDIAERTQGDIYVGIVYGYIGMVDYIVNKIKREMIELGEKEPFVIATGGLAKLIYQDSKTIDKVNAILTLQGLKILYEMNAK